MEKDVILSIVIPIYNPGKILIETIKSIEEVNFSYSYEVILVNDGSTDVDTLELLDEYKQKHIVIDKKNGGPSSARNLGISKAKGKYILPFDSDDLMYKNHYDLALEKMVNDNSIDILYGDYYVFGFENRYNRSGQYNRLKLIQSGCYIPIAGIYKKEVWESIGGYIETLFYAEDWNFWSQAAINNFSFFYFEKPLFKYRRIPDNTNSLSQTRGGQYAEAVKILRSNIPSSIFTTESISEYVLISLKENRKLKIKLLILLFFPILSKYLLKKGYFPNKIIVD